MKVLATIALGAVGLVLVAQPATAAPDKWPKPQYRTLEKALAAQGVSVCHPGSETERSGDISGAYEFQSWSLYVDRPVPPDNLDPTQCEAVNDDGDLRVDAYSSRKVLDRGADSFKRVLGKNEVVVWRWGSTIISLESGARPETIDRVAKAVRTLPSKPKLIVDNR